MQVDEFGREIKGSARRSASPPGGQQYSNNQYDGPPGPPPYNQHPLHHHGPPHSGSSPPARRRDSLPPNIASVAPVSKPRSAHPSERYVDQPLLCGFVWRDKQKEGKSKTEEDNNQDDDEAYQEYKNKYCLNYVRSFFNKHLDDTWFRQRYSPRARLLWLQGEKKRAVSEAQLINGTINEGLDQQKSNPDSQIAFIEQARLDKGTKVVNQVPPPPESHMLNVIPAGKKMLAISEVPPRVNEDQLLSALLDHTEQRNIDPKSIEVHSSSPLLRSRDLPLERSLFVLGDEALIDKITGKLAVAVPSSKSHVPRKDAENVPKTWELDVECRDAYGRAEYDEDGKGGAPPDGLAVPPRKAVVMVTQYTASVKVKTLSAALSSKERIPRDRDAATTIARALDAAWKIPDELCLDKILGRLKLADDEDALDVSIAYLRRVHLFSFYNGCTRAKRYGDHLALRHCSSTVHFRLENADELLMQQDSEVDVDASAPAKDMLVQRLDDSIARALEACSSWITSGLNDETLERDAQAIAEAEEAAEQGWIQKHSINDEGRARCSFHFCHKLFKDQTFLHKHLLKKHPEYLRAEKAKAHDSYMMQGWDEEEDRWVPKILVDCGQKFGMQPSLITGREPTCEDPEPELWKQEQERIDRDRANRQRTAELRAQRRETRIDQGDTGPAPRQSGGFVDVDDMKEEKVELSFENVDVPVPKRKKKKRKLL